ncbi:carboxylate-amine ligase [Leucobacter triazinivorans]|uniref:Putative glutamate--cysteine ligase 2 n=1 Tax=Leucobacter triazinivorans TaxID=1784719 RepID=A0A4P6KD59_9MICO|nr:YbdK family carboxylate-amine ligase [Leucobacter triazinivorans]QBE48227.1 YbdK family carboxylate-amine ligase [Leucobacter triazinivorans]
MVNGNAHDAPTFGVEEEYLLLDAETGLPSDRAAELILAVPQLGARAEREFFSSQLETATPVCREAEEAEQSLAGFRSAVSREAANRGIVLAGTGLPPVGGEEAGTVTPRARYRAIDAELRSASAHQYVTGTHVHVEIPSPDAGVEALARLARWAPMLLALTANSPVWLGAETGFACWRQIMNRSWPVTGYPPPFADGEEYAASVEQLVSSGVLLDPGIVTWEARLSQNYPTLELRIADAQLEVADAVAFAALVRALVARCLRDAEAGEPRPRIAPGLVDGAIWIAARNGLSTELVDPLSGSSVPALEFVERTVETVEPELRRFGDLERVHAYVERRRDGAPARLQLDRFRAAGIPGLLDLYRSCSQGLGVEARVDAEPAPQTADHA